MIREDYVQSSATTRVYEKNLIDRATFNRLIDSSDLEEFKRILGETVYSDVVNLIDSRSEFDAILDKELVDMYKGYYKMARDKILVEILASEYIFHNIKVVLKSYILGEDLTNLIIQITDYNYQAIYRELLENGRVNSKTPFSEYINIALDDYENTKDPQRSDMNIDRFQNEYMLSLAEKVNSPFIIEYVKSLIDAQNINMTFRGKRQNHRINCVYDFIIEGGNIPRDVFINNYFDDIEEIVKEMKNYEIYPSIAKALERYKEDGKLLNFRESAETYLDKIAVEGKKYTYGPEVLFSYMLRKEREVQMIRTIAVGKTNGLSPQAIRERTGELIA